MSTKPHVLFISAGAAPDPKLVALFEGAGMSVATVPTPTQAAHRFNGYRPSLIIFDTELPPHDGMGCLQALHEEYDAGIIILCSNADSVACILGLEMGADDVVARGRDPREIFVRGRRLLARMAEVRAGQPPHQGAEFAGWQLDISRRQLTSPEGERIRLTRGEFELLAALATNSGQVMSRDTLLDHISHREWAPTDRTVDVLVNRLRRKLGEDPRDPRHIVTVHGVGYVLQS